MPESDYQVTLVSGVVSRDYLLVGGPLDADERPEKLFCALGFAASSWARMEQHLDAILLHVNKSDNEELYNPDHPVSFSGKVKLLKQWFNKDPRLADLAHHVREVTSHLKMISLNRNVFLHSILEKWDEQTETATFNGIRYDGDDEFDLSTRLFKLSDIYQFAKLVNLSNLYLSKISAHLFISSAAKRSQKP